MCSKQQGILKRRNSVARTRYSLFGGKLGHKGLSNIKQKYGGDRKVGNSTTFT